MERIPYKTTAIYLSHADNSGQYPVSSDDSVSGKSFAIAMNFTQELVNPGDSAKRGIHENSLGVTGFDVYSLEQYTTFSAGQSLKELFTFTKGSGENGGIGKPLIADDYKRMISGSGPMGGTTWITTSYLLLMQPPTNAGTYNFCVWFDLTDGTHLQDTISVFLSE